MKKLFLSLLLAATPFLAFSQVDSVDSWEGLKYEEQAAYDRAMKEADRLARESERPVINNEDRGLRFELDVPFGYGNNSRLSHHGDAYKNHTLELGATALFHYPLNHRWEASAGAGFRMSWYHFDHSVKFDTSTLLISGHTPTDWRSYSCGAITRSIVVPIRIAVVTDRLTEIYFGFNFAYSLSNTFYYNQVGADDEVHRLSEMDMNNIEAFNKFRAEVAVGMSWPLWWIFSGGWEAYFALTPTFDTSIPGTPTMHEFGLRLTL